MRRRNTYSRNVCKKIDALSMNADEYYRYLRNPKKMIYSNFVMGIARGFGILVGFTILGALVLYLLQMLNSLNIPFLGNLIEYIVNVINKSMEIAA